MTKNDNVLTVEVKSETTGKSVISFESTDKKQARTEGYKRIAEFLGISRPIASLNYFVEIN